MKKKKKVPKFGYNVPKNQSSGQMFCQKTEKKCSATQKTFVSENSNMPSHFVDK